MSQFNQHQENKHVKTQSEDDEEASSDIEDENQQRKTSKEQQQQQPARLELQPSDFYFGTTLGEGAYARVVHAKSKKTGTEFAIKIMEKMHIKRENKVNCLIINCFVLEITSF